MKPLKRGRTICMFGEKCSGCARKFDCISATSAASPPRRYLLKVRGYHAKTTAAMTAGKEMHEKRQEGIPTITSLGKTQFLKQLFRGETIKLSEVAICSPKYGIRGFIDLMTLQYGTDEKFRIGITEIKSSWSKSHLWQLAAYGLVLSDPSCLVYAEVPYKRKKDKMKLEPMRLYPNVPLLRDIDAFLEIKGRTAMNLPFMRDNTMEGNVQGICIALQMRIKARRKYHQSGLYYLESTAPCPWCKQDERSCSLWAHCSKITTQELAKTKQAYISGRDGKLVKSRPRWFS